VSASFIPFSSRGFVAVEYRGDEAAGCSRHGLCGVSGTATWEPGRAGVLFLVEYRDRGRLTRAATLAYEPEDNTDPPTTSQSTRVLPDGSLHTCGDSASSGEEGTLIDLAPGSDGSLVLHPLGFTGRDTYGRDPFLTRCAGPLTRDVRPALPPAVVSAAALRRGRTTVDASGQASFARHGLTGTVRSTERLRLAKPLAIDKDDLGEVQTLANELNDVLPARRIRRVTARYRVASVSGTLTANVSGRRDGALCRPLDACGFAGTLTATPAVTSGSASVSASAGARRPRRDVFGAIGLVRGGSRRGVDTAGSITWPHTPGGTRAELTRPGDFGCADTATLPAGTLSLHFGPRDVRADYFEETGSLLFATRCPGPRADDIGAGGRVASGTVPLRAFRRRLITFRLNRGTSFSGRGWRGRTESDIAVTLRRTGVTERVRRVVP
jgi:hypothetical protein